MNFAKAAILSLIPALALAACSPREEAAPVAAAPAPAPAPIVAAAPYAPVVSASPLAQSIDQAPWSATPLPAESKRDMLIRAQVLLSRAGFSPGVIDGQEGGNLKNAIASFEAAQGLPEDGLLDEEVWKRLVTDTRPVVTDYVVAEADVKGPFGAPIPKDYADMAKLEALSYVTPLESLAEKFHMDEALLTALNPGADFSAPGTRLVVAAPGPEGLAGSVTRIEVDKARNRVRAFGTDGKMMASYPATVGSSDMPTPEGAWEVTQVAFDPHWNYDPGRLNFGDKSKGKLDIKPGPNNPVGAVWIDLSKDTYGIHGAPEPRLVGKTASHGCVRLTNWDARQLARAVSKGTTVEFVGEERKA